MYQNFIQWNQVFLNSIHVFFLWFDSFVRIIIRGMRLVILLYLIINDNNFIWSWPLSMVNSSKGGNCFVVISYILVFDPFNLELFIKSKVTSRNVFSINCCFLKIFSLLFMSKGPILICRQLLFCSWLGWI